MINEIDSFKVQEMEKLIHNSALYDMCILVDSMLHLVFNEWMNVDCVIMYKKYTDQYIFLNNNY